jgi:hypothetical protein
MLKILAQDKSNCEQTQLNTRAIMGITSSSLPAIIGICRRCQREYKVYRNEKKHISAHNFGDYELKRWENSQKTEADNMMCIYCIGYFETYIQCQGVYNSRTEKQLNCISQAELNAFLPKLFAAPTPGHLDVIECVRILLDLGVDVNFRESDGNSALTYLTRVSREHEFNNREYFYSLECDLTVMKMLLENEANPNALLPGSSWTLLHGCCFYSLFEQASILVAYGGKLFEKDSEGKTAIDYYGENDMELFSYSIMTYNEFGKMVISPRDPKDHLTLSKAVNDKKHKLISKYYEMYFPGIPIPVTLLQIISETHPIQDKFLNSHSNKHPQTANKVIPPTKPPKTNVSMGDADIILLAVKVRCFLKNNKHHFKDEHRKALNSIIHYGEKHSAGKAVPHHLIDLVLEADSIMKSVQTMR